MVGNICIEAIVFTVIPVIIQDACFIVLVVDGLARQIIEVIVILLLDNLTPLAHSIGVLENMHFE